MVGDQPIKSGEERVVYAALSDLVDTRERLLDQLPSEASLTEVIAHAINCLEAAYVALVLEKGSSVPDGTFIPITKPQRQND